LQVPLLLRMGQRDLALAKAVDSGDTELGAISSSMSLSLSLGGLTT
jgi:hypothetical protein